MVSYSIWGHEELDITEQQTLTQYPSLEEASLPSDSEAWLLVLALLFELTKITP